MKILKSEVIFRVGCEGGGYDIQTVRTGEGLFFKLIDDGFSLGIEEEQGSGHKHGLRSSLDEVFAEINPIWYEFSPISVHPYYASLIWKHYSLAYQNGGYEHPAGFARWTRMLLGREFKTLNDANAFVAGTAALGDLRSLWQPFASRLQNVLSDMKEDQFLVLNFKETSRFVQFAAQGALGMRAEAVSNHFLSGREQLNASQIRALLKLGWRKPTGNAQQSTPEHDPHGSSNFFVDIPNPIDVAQLSVMAIRTLTEVFGVPHEGFLQYSAYDYAGNHFALQDLELKRETRDPKLKMGELADHLLTLLRDARRMRSLDFSDDGDIYLETYGLPITVRLVGQPPMVRFFSVLLENVRPSRKVFEGLNNLNLNGGATRYMIHKQTVIAVLDIPAWPLQVDHLTSSLDRFSAAIEGAAAWLQVQTANTAGSGTNIH